MTFAPTYLDPFQLQQASSSDGGTGAEAPPLAPGRGEREDGQVAVHSALRGAHGGDKEVTQ